VKTSLHSCNVLEVAGPYAQLWQFSLGNAEVKLQAERHASSTEPLPSGLVAKTWRSLWQPRLNLAWLPAEQVFLRVLHLPAGEPAEVPAMVELQLEKLSPLPVAQIVWSCEVLRGAPAGALQTVIVMLVARSLVEALLGQLEGQGYAPDRLELPHLHSLLGTTAPDDGVWIYPDPGPERKYCLMAWWSDGTLQHLSLVPLPPGNNWGEVLAHQLTETAWAGEFAGWCRPPVRVRVVAAPEGSAAWEAALRPWTGSGLEVEPPLSRVDLAALSARRAASGESTTNLLPPEYAARYRQQFIDRMWMRGLGALLVFYVAGVLVYFGAVEILRFQEHRVDRQRDALDKAHTDAQRLQARVKVLQEQANLKFAALDCWKSVAELLPTDVTLEDLSFQHGKLTLYGTAPATQLNQVNEYSDALSKTRVNGDLLFSKVSAPSFHTVGPSSRWSMQCDVKRMEAE
jgi:hypothetical protein